MRIHRSVTRINGGAWAALGVLCGWAGLAALGADWWEITVVDSEGDVGYRASLALLPSGQPAISYRNNSTRDLRYAWSDGTSWHLITVDSLRTLGGYTSLKILASGQPGISYCSGDPPEPDNFALKYAWFNGREWHNSAVERGAETDQVGLYTSQVILPSGRPAIAYCYLTGSTVGSLRYAERRAVSGDVNCDGAVNFGDIDPFVVALAGQAAYEAQYPDCHWLLADINEDGTVDFNDIDPFVAVLTG